jgi:hypothetical protein
MSKRVEMIALQDVRVEGKPVKKGKPFTCELRDSKILSGTKQAEVRTNKRVSQKAAGEDGSGSGE